MHTKLLDIYNKEPKEGVNNEYPTNKNSFRQPALHLMQGVRTSGKSYSCAKMLAQFKKDKTFDVIYLISPSFNSNKAYFGDYVLQENVFEPTKSSVNDVIARVEADKNAFEQYLLDMEIYKKYQRDIKRNKFSKKYLLDYYDRNFTIEKPEWKYERVEPPKSLLILDDVLGSDAITRSSGIVQACTLNRHLASLENEHSGRSACGLALIILSQSYKYQGGLSRVIRENTSILTLFKNRQQKQLDAIKEELANVVSLELFDRAYEYATKEKYGNLTIDFRPKTICRTFRKNMNELIIFEEMNCDCDDCKKKKK